MVVCLCFMLRFNLFRRKYLERAVRLTIKLATNNMFSGNNYDWLIHTNPNSTVVENIYNI